MLKSLSDAPTNLSNPENNSLITELQKYDASIYFSTDENLTELIPQILTETNILVKIYKITIFSK